MSLARVEARQNQDGTWRVVEAASGRRPAYAGPLQTDGLSKEAADDMVEWLNRAG